MMTTKEFEKEYNTLQFAKKQSALIAKLFSISSVIIIIAILIWAFFINKSTLNKIIVTNADGIELSKEVVERAALLETLVTNHCEESVFYANTFDRLSIKENQARTLFYINTNDAKKIFSFYTINGNYEDALKLGYSYAVTFDRIISLNTNILPYQVKFSAILTINENDKEKNYSIIGSGEIIKRKAKWPENKTGFFFKNYKQDYKLIDNE